MVEIKEVLTKKQQKEFIYFPSKLYQNCKYYSHPIIADEFAIFNPKKNANFEECEMIYFLAYKDGKLAGRVAGILQKASNKKTGLNQVRINRIDFINDFEVAKALFDAVEAWGKKIGMDSIHGPLGFNDLEREGLLVEGFDQMSTFEENYNYDYYADMFDKCGYKKDVDWVEYKIFVPKERNERLQRMSDLLLKKYKLTLVDTRKKRKTINTYKEQIFELLNECYSPLYGVVPITPKLKEQLIAQFKLIVNMRYLSLVTDENNKLVGLGLVFPNIAEEMRDAKGKLLSFKVFKILHRIKHPKVIDLVFMAVSNEYRQKGITSIIMNKILNNLVEDKVEYCESTCELENNYNIRNTWGSFENEQHKRRRCYIKSLLDEKVEPKKVEPKKVATKKSVSKTIAKKSNNKTSKKTK